MSEVVTLHFADAGERDRFDALRQERPEIDSFVRMGHEQAQRFAVPRILNGAMGTTELEISRGIADFLREARKGIRDMPRRSRWNRDEMFAYRLGFEGAALEAKRTVLAAATAGAAAQVLAASLQTMSESPAMAERLSAGLPLPGVGPASPSPAPSAPSRGRVAGVAAGTEAADCLWQETLDGHAPIEGLTDRLLAAEKRGAARLRALGPLYVAEWKAGFMSTVHARLDEHFAALRAANPLPPLATDQPPADTAG